MKELAVCMALALTIAGCDRTAQQTPRVSGDAIKACEKKGLAYYREDSTFRDPTGGSMEESVRKLCSGSPTAFDGFAMATWQVREQLVDPDSARFQRLYRAPDGTVCGLVNAKNRGGGYNGFHAFYVRGDTVRLGSDDLLIHLYDDIYKACRAKEVAAASGASRGSPRPTPAPPKKRP